jgi:hypothetical protein
MANLAELITRKTQNDEQWKAEKRAERENALAIQDAGMTEIGSNPEAYARYLDLQGANPMYSPGNIALAMVQNQELTVFGTKDRWKSLGRSVRESEADNGVQIFARSPLGKGYSLAYAYDISQTSGREMKQTVLLDDTPQMENALGVLLNYSVVPIQTDGQMEDAAYYDAERKELYVNPNVEDHVAFSAIAAEIAHVRFHAKGANAGYSREDCDLDAQSVSYLLCKRFGVEREMPELSGLSALYSGWSPQEIRQALDAVQDMSKQIGGSIDRTIAPKQHSRGPAPRKPAR